MLYFSSFSSSAATGPNPLAGRPRQGPGVLRRDPPMDGTWVPIERGVTATSSKRPVFKETEGRAFSVPDVSDALPTCDYSSHVTASTLSPSVHSEYRFSVPPTAAHTLPLPTLALSHTPTHPRYSSCSLPNAEEGFGSVSMYVWMLLPMKKFTCAGTCFDL